MREPNKMKENCMPCILRPIPFRSPHIVFEFRGYEPDLDSFPNLLDDFGRTTFCVIVVPFKYQQRGRE